MTTTTAVRPPAISVTGSCGSRTATRSCWTASASHVQEGTIFALLGPNGAGKTTAVQIMSTLIPADVGKIAGSRT